MTPRAGRWTPLLALCLALAWSGPAMAKGKAKGSAPKRVRVDFDRAKLGDVAKWYQEKLAVSLLVADDVYDAPVTIVSAVAVTADEAVAALEAAVRADGMTFERSGAFVRIDRRRPRASRRPPGPAGCPSLPTVEPAPDGALGVDRASLVPWLDAMDRCVGASARVVPRYRGDGVEGARVFAIRPRSFFATLGFANGDTILAVDGEAVTGIESPFEALDRARKAERVVFRIERRGAERTIELVLK